LKLLLVMPKSGRSHWGGVSKSGKAGFARLGLTTLAALTPGDWEVEIHDARVSPMNYSVEVDLVGVTGLTSEIPSSYEIADGFRAAGVKVVMGGVHVSALPDEALEHCDAVVIGEAERVWGGLLEDFKKGTLKKRYKGELCDMKNMAVPRRDLLDRSMYGAGFNTMQATRGCPFGCEYCAVTAFFGNKFRVRPSDEVIEEVKGLGAKEFLFMDDNIVGKPLFAKELFEKLIPLNLKWGSQASITLAKNPELLDLFARSGGRYAFIGFESLSQKNLAKMNKGWNSVESYKESIKKIHKAGINVLASFVFGLDEDDASVFQNTYDFIVENHISTAQFHILTPLPGTKTYRQMEEEGRIVDRDWGKYHTGEVVFRPKGMTPEELLDGYHGMYHKFYSLRGVLSRSFAHPHNIIHRLAVNMSYRIKSLKMPA